LQSAFRREWASEWQEMNSVAFHLMNGKAGAKKAKFFLRSAHEMVILLSYRLHGNKTYGGENMLNLEIQTTLTVKEVSERLKKFFGTGGFGLEVKEDTPQCLSFAGGGGYVTANICTEAGKTKVGLITQEWEKQVRNFASTLP
jgi:hypothetical protein